MYEFNLDIRNDIFFADKGFKFYTNMNLNDVKWIDLEINNNIFVSHLIVYNHLSDYK